MKDIQPNRVPKVPGRTGASPLPKPCARICAGCAIMKRPDGLDMNVAWPVSGVVMMS
jgi:hypothetical protein